MGAVYPAWLGIRAFPDTSGCAAADADADIFAE